MKTSSFSYKNRGHIPLSIGENKQGKYCMQMVLGTPELSAQHCSHQAIRSLGYSSFFNSATITWVLDTPFLTQESNKSVSECEGMGSSPSEQMTVSADPSFTFSYF